jgi:hypothetical protein
VERFVASYSVSAPLGDLRDGLASVDDAEQFLLLLRQRLVGIRQVAHAEQLVGIAEHADVPLLLVDAPRGLDQRAFHAEPHGRRLLRPLLLGVEA